MNGLGVGLLQRLARRVLGRLRDRVVAIAELELNLVARRGAHDVGHKQILGPSDDDLDHLLATAAAFSFTGFVTSPFLCFAAFFLGLLLAAAVFFAPRRRRRDLLAIRC